MKKSEDHLLEATRFLLIILWVYAAVSKISDLPDFRAQMQIQTLPPWVSGPLVYILPGAELIAAGLLLYRKTTETGLHLSFLMMVVFTGYVGLVILNFFGRVPCSCGGVISHLSWKAHLVFNVFFLLLTFYGIYIVHRERRILRQLK